MPTKKLKEVQHSDNDYLPSENAVPHLSNNSFQTDITYDIWTH